MRSVGKERTSGLDRQTVQSGEELSGPLSLKGVSLMVVPGVHTCLGQCCLMISSGTFNMSSLWMTPKQKEQLVHKVGRGVIQRDLDKQQECAMNIKKFYKDKCKVLHLGQSNPCINAGRGPTHQVAALQNRICGFYRQQVYIAQWCTLKSVKDECILRCISNKISRRMREVIIPYCLALVRFDQRPVEVRYNLLFLYFCEMIS